MRSSRGDGRCAGGLGWILWLVVVLQGCASIVSGTTQVVSVDAPGCPGARCELSNDKGKYFVQSTPGTVTLGRSYNNLQVICSRDGVDSDPLSVASATKGMAFGNILFGGVIGAGVDVSTGAAYDYPQLITVPLHCGPGSAATLASAAAAPAAARLGLQVERLEAVAGAAAPPGAKIVQVEPQSAADLGGMKVGDVIRQINGNAVRDPAGLAAQVATLTADRSRSSELDFLLRRGAEDLVRRVTLPAAPPR